MRPVDQTGAGYRIGTVAHLTGLDQHTIRAWEARYGAVKPRRSERGTRLYDDDAVERLQLLKAVVDCGEPIRLAAAMSDDTLRERLERMAGLRQGGAAPAPAEATELTIAAIGSATTEQLRASALTAAGYRVVYQRDAYAPSVREDLAASPPDVLVLDLEALGESPVQALVACRSATDASVAVVTYTFASRLLLAKLAKAGARLMRGPVRSEQLRRALDDYVVAEAARSRNLARPAAIAPAAPMPIPSGPEPGEPRFSAAQLARLSEIGSAIDCECPNHLADLVGSLLAFERYSRHCESRDADDAALHAMLARGTGEARAKIEDLLTELIRIEGIEID